MLLDKNDIDKLFTKKCYCFGAAVATGMATAGTTAAGVATSTIFASTGAAISANMSLIGGLVSTVGMIQQGQAAASQANFQAGVANNNAIIAQQQATRARQQSRIDAQDFARQQSDLQSSRRALLGKTGVGAGSGSPLAVSSDFAGESELNRMRIINQGFVNENRLQQEVMNQKAQAGLFAASGRQSQTGSLFKAGGQLFKTGRSVFNTPGADKAFNLRKPQPSFGVPGSNIRNVNLQFDSFGDISN